MYEFVDRLINLALPRLRDFRGLSLRAFDGRGNYSIGLPEQLVFPEIDYDSIDQIRGLEVTMVTSAQTDAHARRLLEAIGSAVRTRRNHLGVHMAKKCKIV